VLDIEDRLLKLSAHGIDGLEGIVVLSENLLQPGFASMMTVFATMAGLLPIMWSHGTGAEVMQRIAVPMIGGMVSSTLLTLIVIPAIYAVVKGIAIRSPRLAPAFKCP
jgi:Cu/Ag efflux pump CusA